MRHWVVVLALASLVLPSAAMGQVRDTKAADALFTKARDLMARGDYRSACPMLAESQKLDPAPGTLLNLADCEEHTGDLVSAREHWRAAIAGLPPADEALPIAKRRLEALEARLPKLTLRLAPGAPSDARVMCDGAELAGASLGVPMALNPGSHAVVVQAAGRVEQRETVVLAEGDHRELTVQAGQPRASEPPQKPVLEKPLPPPVPAVSWWKLHTGSLVTVGVAAALFGTGLGVGERTRAHYFSLAKTCSGPCPENELSALHREQIATNVLLAASGAVALTAIGLYVFAERPPKPSAALIPAPGGASLLVRF